MRDVIVYLQDIVDAIESIQEYTKGLDYQGFSKDKKTVDAVVRNFEIIGEAAKNVPLSLRKKYPQLPWSDMAGDERQAYPRIFRSKP